MRMEHFEVTTENAPNPNKEVEFGQQPCHCTCPHCGDRIMSFVEYEASWSAYVLSFCIFILCGWPAFCIVPIFWPLLKDVVHHCPKCLNVIEVVSRIQCPKVESQMMTFRFGNCACLLTRKYVVMIAVLIFFAISYYWIHAHNWDKVDLTPGPDKPYTWAEYERDCGKMAYNQNPIRSVTVYEKTYQGNTYKWEGVVQRIREGIDIFFIKTKSLLFLQMAHGGSYAPRWESAPTDVVLMFDDDLNGKVSMLKPGNKIEFNATLFGLGRRGSPHVLNLWDVSDLGASGSLAKDDLSESDFEKDQASQEQRMEDLQEADGGNPQDGGDGSNSAGNPEGDDASGGN